MTLTADKATGAFFVIFGLVLYFLVIPAHVEAVDSGWVFPNTIPNAAAITIGFCGALLMLKSTAHQPQDLTSFLLAGFYLLLLAAGIYLISLIGFLYASPIIALALMLFIGERRPFWLALGVVGVPALIWIFVVQLLDRALP